MVRSLGVTLGQGYLLARPAAAETWTVAEPEKRRTAASSRRPHRRTGEHAPDPQVSVGSLSELGIERIGGHVMRMSAMAVERGTGMQVSRQRSTMGGSG